MQAQRRKKISEQLQMVNDQDLSGTDRIAPLAMINAMIERGFFVHL